eukprot:g2296.t1
MSITVMFDIQELSQRLKDVGQKRSDETFLSALKRLDNGARLGRTKSNIRKSWTQEGGPSESESKEQKEREEKEKAEEKLSPEKKEKMMVQRGRIVQEIVATEESYLEQLSALIELYIQPLRGKPELLPLKTQDILFSNLASLHDMNQFLLKDLKERQGQSPELIGQVFIDFCPFLVLYRDYAKYNAEAIKVLTKLLAEKSKFTSFCEKAAGDPRAKGLSLQALLITPIQRLPRYKLLLEELLKQTLAGHPDYPALLRAIGMVHEAAATVNSAVRADREGWLLLRGPGRASNAQPGAARRWCRLSGSELSWFADQSKRGLLGSCTVDGARTLVFVPEEAVEEQAATKENNVGSGGLPTANPAAAAATTATSHHCFSVKPHLGALLEQGGTNAGKKYTFQCDSAQELKDWLRSLEEAGALHDGVVREGPLYRGS